MRPSRRRARGGPRGGTGAGRCARRGPRRSAGRARGVGEDARGDRGVAAAVRGRPAARSRRARARRGAGSRRTRVGIAVVGDADVRGRTPPRLGDHDLAEQRLERRVAAQRARAEARAVDDDVAGLRRSGRRWCGPRSSEPRREVREQPRGLGARGAQPPRHRCAGDRRGRRASPPPTSAAPSVIS